jgi:hypothetical protein
MPSITLIATVDDKKLWRAAEEAAGEVGFSFADEEDGFRLRKGNLLASIFLGAFIKYVNAEAVVSETKTGDAKIEFSWSSPFWTGLIGVGRTKTAMKEYVTKLEDFIEDDGGEVLKRTGP